MTDTGAVEAQLDAPVHKQTDEPSISAVADSAHTAARKSAEAAASPLSNGTAGDTEREQKAARKSTDAGAAGSAAAQNGSTGGTSPDKSDLGGAGKSGDLGSIDRTAEAPALAARKSSDAAGKGGSGLAAPAPVTPGTTAGGLSKTGSGTVAAAVAGLKAARSSSGGLPPAAASFQTAGAPERRSSTASTEDLPDGSAPKVKALREQLSQVRQHMASPYGEKQNGTVLLSGGVAQPVSPEPRPETPAERRVSEHDRVNNTNALELLQMGAFKLVPGKDTVPYDKLIGLRLEDGIDVTRKEEYLSADDFKTVFKMDRPTFVKLPQWKRLQLKKSTLLF